MSSLVHDAGAVSAEVGSDYLTVILRDGRRISVPLSTLPRLANASVAERQDWRIIGSGEGIHWPQLDEDVSVSGMLAS